jgi:hypothetical protein
MATHDPNTNREFARVLIKMGIGLIGLILVRLIVQNLPMVHDAGSIVPGKLTVLAGALMAIDTMLLSVLVTFGIELRGYLHGQFPAIPGLATMTIDLVCLITGGLAYADFKPLTRTWPSIKQAYTWTFLTLVAIPVIQMIVMLYRNRDEMASMFLQKLMAREKSDPVETAPMS